MKKLLALILAVICCLGMVACGGEDHSKTLDDAISMLNMNYKDMNSLYKACKNVLPEDGSSTEADFEYRMRNSSGNAEQDMLLAAKSIAENIKYQ